MEVHPNDAVLPGELMKKYVSATVLSASLLTTLLVSTSNVIGGSMLPARRQATDIGAVALRGSTTYSSGTYTVKASGADIWDTADQFHFVYQPVSGNAEIIARVAAITNTNPWAKAGVMIRESLTAQSRHAMVAVSAANGYAFQRRPDVGGYSVHTAGGSGAAPGWVKLVRAGDLYTAYRSANGRTWTMIGSDTIPMGNTVYVGLAATSHNNSSLTTAVLDNFKVNATTSTNQDPAVSITSPINGASVTLPTTFTITATATDAENRMASVDFYADFTLISKDTTAPYSVTWAPSAAGTYALSARAYDADGGSSTSSAVNVIVNPPTNKAPTVSLSTDGSSFVAPAAILLTATASDPEGQLARVDFFNGTTLLVSDTSVPYSFSWTNVAAETYTVRAVAYDAAGASATSASVTVIVAEATSTAPRLVAFTASADHSTNVISYLLEVFRAGADVSTATPVAFSDLGKPSPDSTNTITVDCATFFNGLATGTYIATVTAIGLSGQAQSDGVTFTR